MTATFKLLTSYFVKTIHGPIIAFIFPSILMGILGSIFRINYVFPGIVAMTILFIGVLSLPLSIMEMRGSSLFKYIGSSPINPRKFMIIVILFYVIIMMISILILFFASFGFFSEKIFRGSSLYFEIAPGPNYPNPIEVGGDYYHLVKPVYVSDSLFSNLITFSGFFQFLFSLGIAMGFSILAGMAIATYSKTPQQSLTISIVIIIPTIFLSGMVISVDIIAQSKIMQWISRVIPFRYTTANLVEATAPVKQFELYLTEDQQSLLMGEGGATMRKLILDEQYPLIKSSSSGIFDFTRSFTVRRISSNSQIRNFLIRYLAGGDEDNINTSSVRFVSIWNKIQKGNWDWLDLFQQQNNILYTQAEKVLNIFLPMILSGGMAWYIIKRFKWTLK